MPSSIETIEKPSNSSSENKESFRLRSIAVENGQRTFTRGEMVTFRKGVQNGRETEFIYGVNPGTVEPADFRQYEEVVSTVDENDAQKASEMLYDAYEAAFAQNENLYQPAAVMITKNGEIAWSADDNAKTTGLVLVRGDGAAEHLGAGEERYGVIRDVTKDTTLYMAPNSLILAMKDTDQLDADGLKQAYTDTDERYEMTKMHFENALANPAEARYHKRKAETEQRRAEWRAKHAATEKTNEKAEAASTPDSEGEPDRKEKAATDSDRPALVLEELRDLIRKAGGGYDFKITDKRKWDRETGKPIHATSDNTEVVAVASTPESDTDSKAVDSQAETEPVAVVEPTHHGKHEANSPLDAKSAVAAERTDHGKHAAITDPRVGTVREIEYTYKGRYSTPPLPDHAPTGQPTVESSEADTEPVEDNKQSLKEKLMDKFNNPFQELATRLTWAHMILSGENQEKSESEKPDKEKRSKTIKRVLGVAAIVAVATVLARDNPEFQHTVADAMNSFSGAGEGPLQGGLDPIQERIVQEHTEILNAPVNIIPFGGSGTEFTAAHGVDPSLWYQHQNEFMQKFPNEGYRMLDGNVGFSKPGELSDGAKQFWAQKFGKWQ